MGVRDAIILGKRSVRHICTRPTTTFKKFCPAVAITSVQCKLGKTRMQYMAQFISGYAFSEDQDNSRWDSLCMCYCYVLFTMYIHVK